MKEIIIISFSWLDRDPRIIRQIYFLKDRFRITTIGFSPPHFKDIKFFKIPSELSIISKLKIVLFSLLKLYESAYWSSPRVKNTLRILTKDQKADIILANDLNTLPLATYLAKKWGSKLICDLHEYAPAEFDAKPLWKHIISPYNNYLCKRYIKKADRLITICESVAEKYKNNYKVECEVIDNATFYISQSPTKIKNEQIKMIHHGIGIPERKIENMIHLVKFLDKRYHLDLMLMPYNKKYIKKLKKMVYNENRIKIINPVQSNKIPYHLNKYDIGLFLLSPEHTNYFMALPNKLFEFIQARLCVAIWPSIEMKKIVDKYQCGIVTTSFSITEMARKLNSLTANDIYRYKLNSHKAAKILCAEKNKEKFLKIIEN